MSVPTWGSGIQYNYGDIIEYESIRYKIIQPHRSMSDWTPPVMPALWGPIPDSDWQRHEPYNPPHDTGDYHSQDVHQTDDCNQHPDQTIEVPHALQRKKWSDLDDKRRKQLEIGGGLSVGASLIGGGYHAWRQNGDKKISDEQKQIFTWGVQGWLRDAHARTEEFRNHGPRGPTSWVLVEGRDKIPRSALQVGKDKDGNPNYIARVYFEDSTQIGEASSKTGSTTGFDGGVIEHNKFEVLIGDPRGVKWVPYSSELNVRKLGATPVEGGKDIDNPLLFVARGQHDGGVHTAKVGEHFYTAHIPFNGEEVCIHEYEVLCLS